MWYIPCICSIFSTILNSKSNSISSTISRRNRHNGWNSNLLMFIDKFIRPFSSHISGIHSLYCNIIFSFRQITCIKKVFQRTPHTSIHQVSSGSISKSMTKKNITFPWSCSYSQFISQITRRSLGILTLFPCYFKFSILWLKYSNGLTHLFWTSILFSIGKRCI